MSIIDKIEKFGKKAESTKKLVQKPNVLEVYVHALCVKYASQGNDTSWLADLNFTAS